MMANAAHFETLAQLLDDSSRRFADEPLFGVRRDGAWSWTSYREFRVLVDACRAGLVRLGVSPGDRVAVISNNRLEWAIAAFASYTLGAVYVPMYESQHDDDWEYILRDAGVSVCLCATAKIVERVGRLRSSCPALGPLVVFDGPPHGALSFSTLLESGASPSVQSLPVSGAELASIIYTSGTTGNPKGVELSHANLASNVSAILAVTPLSPGERSVGFLPWAHVYGGCLEIHTALASGGAVAICDDPSKLMDYLQEARPTLLFAVPRIWNRVHEAVMKQMSTQPPLVQAAFRVGMGARTRQRAGEPISALEHLALAFCKKVVFPKIVARLGGRLRLAFSGAAALSKDVAEFIDNLGIEVYEGYGMTECAGVITTNQPGTRRIGSVGRAVPGVRIVLQPLGRGADAGEGEIVVYGPGLMQGYHGLDSANGQVLSRDGGLRTGDLGRLDEDGFLYITGRVKDLFKLSNGRYVAPAAIEERFQLSPYIAQCLVYGDDQPYPVALIVVAQEELTDWARRNGVGPSMAEIIEDPRTRDLYVEELERLGQTLRGYERVRGFVLELELLSIENGMLTPTLKLKRRSVVQRHAEQLRAIYEAAPTTTHQSGMRWLAVRAVGS
jgi:long-chain acyl-CoA synthetase